MPRVIDEQSRESLTALYRDNQYCVSILIVGAHSAVSGKTIKFISPLFGEQELKIRFSVGYNNYLSRGM